MPKEKYKVGDRFGRWTLLEKLPKKTRNHNIKWKVICDCGLIKVTYAGNLVTGKSKGCSSCAAREREARFRREGLWGRGMNS
jgi:hypothetical protein